MAGAAHVGLLRPTGSPLGPRVHRSCVANDSDNDACAWSDEARSLVEHGYAVAVFETVGNYNYEAQQVLEVARALRRSTGVRRIAVIGASVGARAVLKVGARHPRTDAAMMRDYDRFASLFTHDGAWRMPYVGVEFIGSESGIVQPGEVDRA